MATIESFDFETGAFPVALSDTSNDPVFTEVSAASPLTGSYSMRVYTTAASANRAYAERGSFNSSETNVYWQFKFRTNQRVNHNSGGYIRIFSLTVSGVGYRGIDLQRDGATEDEYIGTAIILPNTTYTIEVHLKRDSTTGGIKIWVDGVEALDAQDGDIVGTQIQDYLLGVYDGGPETSGLDARIDDIIVADAYIGVGSVNVPTGALQGSLYGPLGGPVG